MKNLTKIIVAAAGMAAAVPAFSQSVTHWIDRQVHGTARHVTPRHHKPGEPLYRGEKVTYVSGRPMVISRRKVVVIHHRHRHHWR